MVVPVEEKESGDLLIDYPWLSRAMGHKATEQISDESLVLGGGEAAHGETLEGNCYVDHLEVENPVVALEEEVH